MKRAFLLILALVIVAAAVIWWLRGVQQADPDPGYAPRVSSRTWATGGPAVIIDDGHWNEHTAVRGFAPFAKLLTADGYAPIDHGNAAAGRCAELRQGNRSRQRAWFSPRCSPGQSSDNERFARNIMRWLSHAG
jgi:hypothetical protein